MNRQMLKTSIRGTVVSAKGILDPVHDWIPLTIQELAVIDHPLFQRLRGVRQLSGTEAAFCNAMHNRFSHCIGAAHIAGLYGQTLFGAHHAKTKLVRMAALLHDIAHGPFSHEFDKLYSRIYGKAVHKGHDVKRHDLIRKCADFRALIEAAGVSVDAICAIWSGTGDPALSAIVQGPLGADRLDFLSRDSYFTATRSFGGINVGRITRCCTIQTGDDGVSRLHYYQKVLPDICNALLGRFHMYRHVYYHKTSCAAGLIMESMLRDADNAMNLMELARSTDAATFSRLTDDYVTGGLLHLASAADGQSPPKSVMRWRTRDLPKVCFERTVIKSQKSRTERWLAKRLRNVPAEWYAIRAHGPTFMLDANGFERCNVRIVSEIDESLTFADAIKQEEYFKGILERDVGHYILRVYALDATKRDEIEAVITRDAHVPLKPSTDQIK